MNLHVQAIHFYVLFWVKVEYESGMKEISADIADVVKCFAQGRNKLAYKSLMKLLEAEKTIKDSEINKMNNELQTLSSSSMLKNTNLNDFVKAPDTFSMLKIICISKQKQKRNNLEEFECSRKTAISTIAAMILHSRCPELSALVYRIGLYIVRFSGAGRMVRLLICLSKEKN